MKPADDAAERTETRDETRDEPRGKRLFGRRKGHRLSPTRAALVNALLPRMRFDLAHAAAPLAQFSTLHNDLWLEIGFGAGEHLVWQAETYPYVAIIGCEPFENGVAKLLTAIHDRNLENIRIHDDDARDLIAALPDAAIARAFILFPDPWPKARHVKRRLIDAPFLANLARVMRPGGELRVATDIGDYLRTIMDAFEATPEFAWQAERPADWRVRPGDWPATRYEQKAEAAGRLRYYLRFLRRSEAQ